MRMIRFREKHGDRIFVFSNSREKQLILAQVAQDRLAEGYWYDDENGSEQVDLLKPTAHLSDAERIGQLLEKLFDPSKREWEYEPPGKYLDQIQRWMMGRRDYEYEDWDELPIETCEITTYEGSVRRSSQSD
jgi:hypothetical protein